ncbi:uncharacterized protein A4U43_C10F18270 [Asparagus officinalis]|uniref:Filament-like plant protein n=1 Tax=Asparagus officinalis TaxID=4686 RepID=A0A5P1E3N0_ASPOF|nr:uncharacterized protein A4U43_C10F18270 [Asparagus officinalis]
MDRRSWLWRRKSSDKSAGGETESSGSVSSISERYSDDQEALRGSPVRNSPNNARSPEVTSKIEVHETVKSLNEKLSAALFSISAKEDLVREHAKVAEEAVAGWEKAEKELSVLKQHLETTTKKNSALEDRIGHLDAALKECLRQLRQSREEQEQKLQETLIKKTNDWECLKLELETHITELQAQLEARKAEATIFMEHDLQLKLQAIEKENSNLKAELLTTFDKLQMKTIEMELSTRAAETASKQRLESIKKVSKLEAECRKLQASAKRSSPLKELNCPDSYASARKVLSRNLTSSVEIDLMDDFLEMERVAALPEADRRASKGNPSMAEFDALTCEINALAIEKQDMEMVLAETGDQLNISQERLIVAETKLNEMQRQLNSANGSKHTLEMEVESLESKKKELEAQLETMNFEVEKLREEVRQLEGKAAEISTSCQNIEALILEKEQLEAQLVSANMEVEKERTLSSKLAAKCKNMEAVEAEKIELESKLMSAENKIISLGEKLEEQIRLSSGFTAKVNALEEQREALRSQLEDAHIEAEKLRDKMGILEKDVEIEKTVSAEFVSKTEILEAKKDKLSSLLRSESLEAEKLREKIGILENETESKRVLSLDLETRCKFLEEKIEGERKLSAEFAAKCQTLKDEIEKEIVVASGKLADCQKTIASLSQQLKSLKDFDLMLEIEGPDLDDKENFGITNAQESGLRKCFISI